MATIQDVAKQAGLSVATVSRVINNSSSVTPKTRERVQGAIKALRYQPNLLGRNLRRMETRMVLVLLPNISNTFYAKIVKGIEDIAHINGYNVMLCNSDSDPTRERVYIELLKNRLADGIIFMASQITAKEMNDIGKKFPLVQCCEYREGVSITHVSIDNYQAAYRAVSHLLELGRRRIGLISSRNKFLSTLKREEGYQKALNDSDIAFDKSLIKYGDYGYKSGFSAAEQLLNCEPQIDAIFAISDIMAIGAANAIKGKGLNVPRDIAVCGFDDISFAFMFNPQITTIAQPTYEMGCAAMELLLRQIRGEPLSRESVIMDFELKIRATTVS